MRKKLLACLLMAACLLWGCDSSGSESSRTEEDPVSREESAQTEIYALIGGGESSASRWKLYEKREVAFEDREWEISKLKGTSLSLPFFETVEVPLYYKNSFRMGDDEYGVDRYWSKDGQQVLALDRGTGRPRVMILQSFPEGYPLRTEGVSREEAFEIVKAFLQEHFPELRPEEMEDVSQETEGEYEFAYRMMHDGIILSSMTIKTDLCGNLYWIFMPDHYMIPPSYSEADCMEAAMERIQAYCDTRSDAETIKDAVVEERRVEYLADYECYAVSVRLSFTVVYKDGAEEQAWNRFYLPYDDKGAPVSFEAV